MSTRIGITIHILPPGSRYSRNVSTPGTAGLFTNTEYANFVSNPLRHSYITSNACTSVDIHSTPQYILY